MDASNVQVAKDRAALQFAGTLTGRKYAAVMTDRGGIVRACGEWWSALQATQHRGQAERLYRKYAGQWHPCEWEPKTD